MEFNQLLGVAQRYARGVAAQLGQEEQLGVSTVTPELQVVLETGGGMPPEMRRFAGEKLCSGGALIAASAANISKVGLSNPVGSRILAIVTEIIVNNLSTAVRWAVRSGGESGFVGVVISGVRDLRYSSVGSLAAPICQLRTDNTSPGSSGFVVGEIFLPATPEIVYFRHPHIIPPGSGLHISSSAINFGAHATFIWIERPGSDKELQIL